MFLLTDHFLAVMDSEDDSVSPSLYLKEIPSSEKQYSEEILFKVRTNRSVLMKFLHYYCMYQHTGKLIVLQQ